jgi:hypothetical protein
VTKKDAMAPRFDIIGDIHGCADQLEELLSALGYVESDGAYRHTDAVAAVDEDVGHRPRERGGEARFGEVLFSQEDFLLSSGAVGELGREAGLQAEHLVLDVLQLLARKRCRRDPDPLELAAGVGQQHLRLLDQGLCAGQTGPCKLNADLLALVAQLDQDLPLLDLLALADHDLGDHAGDLAVDDDLFLGPDDARHRELGQRPGGLNESQQEDDEGGSGLDSHGCSYLSIGGANS